MNVSYILKRIRGEWYKLIHPNVIGKSPAVSESLDIDKAHNALCRIGSFFSTGGAVKFKMLEKGSLKIGDRCFFNNNACITTVESIEIGRGCTFGNNLVIVDHDHDYINNTGLISKPVVIGDNVWVGANVVILRGCIIGDNSVIAAGSIVKGIIPPNTLYYQERVIVNKKIEKI